MKNKTRKWLIGVAVPVAVVALVALAWVSIDHIWRYRHPEYQPYQTRLTNADYQTQLYTGVDAILDFYNNDSLVSILGNKNPDPETLTWVLSATKNEIYFVLMVKFQNQADADQLNATLQAKITADYRLVQKGKLVIVGTQDAVNLALDQPTN